MNHMNRIGWTPLGILGLLVVALTAGTAWSYDYVDNFETDTAQSDSYAHSTFWASDVSPLPEPYLYYIDTNQGRGIAFVDYKGQPAELSYCLPLGSAQVQRAVKGTLQVDVSFPSNATISQYLAGHLSYRTSSDGMGWSTWTALAAGRRTIPISSASGTCYITFSGTRAVIDNLNVSLSSPSATIHVPGNFATIQAAINFAGNGDVIEVASGTYSGTGNWDLEFRGKAITLRSANGAASTIIDCGAPASGTGHRGFYFHQGEDSDTLVSGFTIKGGRIFGTQIPSSTSSWSSSSSHPVGGGIYCEFSSPSIANCIITDCGAEIGGGIGVVGGQPTITNCVIRDCKAGGFGAAASGGRGGAIGLIGQSNAMVANCTIEDNFAYSNSTGAGLYCFESTAVIAGCRLTGNSAPGNLDGGGAYCAGARTDVLFQNCIFSNNIADSGAGLFAEWSSSFGPSSQRTRVRVVNCTLAQNRLSGFLGGGGIESSGADILVNSSIVWHNDGSALAIANAVSSYPVTYSNIEGGYVGVGNTNQTPAFASLAGEDYHLRSSYGRYNAQAGTWSHDSQNSPCIDAGDPLAAPTEEPAPNGGQINMGAYGGTREASKSAEHFVYHVDAASGRDWNNGRSRAYAFETIQKAIDKASAGDTVLVWPGTYQEDLSFNRKAITVQSAADAAVIVAKVAYAFSFFSAESSKSMVSNFVIRNCSVGAIFCAQGASPTLKNLTIVDNDYGIEAYDGSNPYIVNCILWGNSRGDLFGCEAHHSCIQHDPPDTRSGNINADPLFADPDNGDFHLKSEYGRYVSALGTWTQDNVSSPCIDAGDGDLEEYPRAERTPNGVCINMGAYGGTPYASLSGWPPN